jgi:hypothetical protein
MLERAKSFVALPRHWIQIEALATALIERRTLSGRQARKVYREALSAENVVRGRKAKTEGGK